MLLTLDQVSKSYFNESGSRERLILDKLQLHAGEGEQIAITGPSGSGKTTLLNMIGTLDRPDSGQILFDGLDLCTLDESHRARFRRETAGFVFQQHHLLPQLTLLENILLPTLADRKLQGPASVERARRLVTRLGLEQVAGQKPGQLSGGECQRTAVARALINKPRLILADEPTGALDHQTANNLVDLLTELHREENLTLILVTHSQEIARRMDTIYLLEDGKLVRQQN